MRKWRIKIKNDRLITTVFLTHNGYYYATLSVRVTSAIGFDFTLSVRLTSLRDSVLQSVELVLRSHWSIHWSKLDLLSEGFHNGVLTVVANIEQPTIELFADKFGHRSIHINHCCGQIDFDDWFLKQPWLVVCVNTTEAVKLQTVAFQTWRSYYSLQLYFLSSWQIKT